MILNYITVRIIYPLVPTCFDNMAGFNECTRVQVPAALHLCRLGYTYFAEYGEGTPVGRLDKNNNVLTDEFLKALVRLNPEQKLHDLEIINQMFQKLLVNAKQIEALTTQRNTLLPLLMTGQIEVM